MTAVSPGVLILLGVALAVGVILALGALGIIPITMDAPRDPWWRARRERRARAAARTADRADGEEPTVDERADADPAGTVRTSD